MWFVVVLVDWLWSVWLVFVVSWYCLFLVYSLYWWYWNCCCGLGIVYIWIFLVVLFLVLIVLVFNVGNVLLSVWYWVVDRLLVLWWCYRLFVVWLRCCVWWFLLLVCVNSCRIGGVFCVIRVVWLWNCVVYCGYSLLILYCCYFVGNVWWYLYLVGYVVGLWLDRFLDVFLLVGLVLVWIVVWFWLVCVDVIDRVWVGLGWLLVLVWNWDWFVLVVWVVLYVWIRIIGVLVVVGCKERCGGFEGCYVVFESCVCLDKKSGKVLVFVFVLYLFY